MKIKILFISYDGMTDPLGRSQVLPYLSGLAANGYEVNLLSFEKPARFLKDQNLITEFCKKNNIRWFPLKYHSKPPVLSTLWDVYKMFKLTGSLIRSEGIAVLHCRSYLSALAGLHFKKKYKSRIKFIFDMRGFWADERIDGKIWNLKNPIYKTIYNYFKRKELEFLTEADACISLTEAAKIEILSWKNIKNKQPDISVIPCCADLSHFNYLNIADNQKQSLMKRLEIPVNNQVVTYVGSLGTWYMLDEMLLFFQVCLRFNPQSTFLIITPDQPQHVYNLANQMGIPEKAVKVISADRNEVPIYLSLSSFSLCFIKPSFSKKASSPTKLAEIMGMGVPVVCNSGVGDVAEIVKQYNCGVILHSINTDSCQNALFELNKKQENVNWPSQIRSAAEQYASLNEGVRRYLNVYAKILSHDGTSPLL